MFPSAVFALWIFGAWSSRVGPVVWTIMDSDFASGRCQWFQKFPDDEISETLTSIPQLAESGCIIILGSHGGVALNEDEI